MRPRNVAIIAIGLAAAAAFGLFLLNTAAHRNDYRPVESGQVSAGLYAIKDVNIVRFMPCPSDFFVMRAGEELILFDTAINGERIASEMRGLGLDPEKVSAVFLTHSDAEHAKALKVFSHAVVYVSEKEAPLIEGKRLRAPFLRNRLEAPYRALKDGQRLSFPGAEVECISVPGHTLGSMAYLVNGKILFPGDTLVVREGKATVSKGLFVNMDGKALADSMARLSRLQGIEEACTDHYGIVRDYPGLFRK